MTDPDLVNELQELESALSANKTESTEAMVVEEGAKQAQVRPHAEVDVLWTIRLEQFLVGFWSKFREMIRGLWSHDRPTRWVSLFFIMSVFGLITVITVGVYGVFVARKSDHNELTKAELEQQHLSEFFVKQAEESRRAVSLARLGAFTVSIKSVPDHVQAPGVLNLAELEVVLETDSKETRIWVEENIAAVRSQLTNVFLGFDRDEILTREGKRKLKKALIGQLNGWLPHGRVEDLFFPMFIVN